MNLTDKQKTEVTSLQKIIKQCEGITRTSQNSDILKRVKIDLKKAKDRLNYLCPEGVPAELLSSDKVVVKKQTLEMIIQNYSILSQFTIQKLSPHCDNNDTNLLATIIRTWDASLSPALSDQHVTLDFSITSERDAFHVEIENLKWQMKTLAHSIEDYTLAVRQESKIQLHELKTRQSRNFMITGSNFIKKLHQFWRMVYENSVNEGYLCTNLEDVVHFSLDVETVPLLEGQTVTNVLKILTTYLQEALEVLNPPK